MIVRGGLEAFLPQSGAFPFDQLHRENGLPLYRLVIHLLQQQFNGPPGHVLDRLFDRA
ncbi:hypothetical protein D3C87_1688740 [compost metagenome]